MKWILQRTCLLIVFMACALPLQAGDGVMETVERYTQALGTGDVSELKAVLGGRMYAKRRILLEENTEYPDFLRQHYAGASFSSAVSSRTSSRYSDGTLVDVSMLMSSGKTVTTTLVLQPVDGAGWKIIDELR